jgi:hypothetical protein
MTINNNKVVVGLRIRLFFMTVLVIAWIIVAYFAKIFKFPMLGMSDTIWTLIILAVYFLLAFYPMFLNYQFIVYSDEGEKIIFRYSAAGIVGGRKNSVEIPKEIFAGYRIEKKLFGLIRSVTLFQQVKNGIAKYPPIHISVLTKQERGRILNSLHMHAPADAADIKK